MRLEGANMDFLAPPLFTKIVFINLYRFITKKNVNGDISIIEYDLSNLKENIKYTSNSGDIKSIHYGFYRGGAAFAKIEMANHNRNRIPTGGYVPQEPYPIYLHIAEGETETPETPTKTILFPPPETHEQFMHRISARLLNLTRRIRALRHEEPHQNALSKNICREVPADHAEVLRYDIACNLLKRPVGWLALQLQTHQNRYNQHLAAVVKAKEAGRTPPTFGYDSERPKLETMLDKLEANLTEECLEEHFDMHDHAEWDKVQNKQRKITLCNEDSTPGEVLVDVNAFFTDGRGNIAEEHAKRTYHEISTKYWVMAKRTPHRKLVTQRTVEIA